MIGIRSLLLSVPSIWFLYSSIRRPSVGALALYAKLSGFQQRGITDRTVLFYPEAPNLRHSIWKALALKKVKFHCDPKRPHDLAVLWEDSTVTNPETAMALSRLSRRVVNRELIDISKARVAAVFEQIFGYPLAVDPRTHRGPCVRKSNANAAHDGQIIECPMNEMRPGCVYEILIDNRCDDQTVLDYRLPVIGGETPFVERKYRPLAGRFATISRVDLTAPASVFSDRELDQIKRFCRAFGCDLGELDILRDRNSGRIYIVDVNRTPFGPPKRMPIRDSVRRIKDWADAFERRFLDT